MTSIYALVDPRTCLVRYVGQTVEPRRRVAEHIGRTGSARNRSHRDNWIRSLLKLNLKPHLEVLEQVPPDQADQAERFYIALFRALGTDLLNVADGGDRELKSVRALIPVGWKQSAEAKTRIATALRGRKPSGEARLKMSVAAKQRFQDGRNRNLKHSSR